MLVIRDVTSIVMNDELMESKRHMTDMTEKLMRQMEEMATETKSKLEKMDPYVQAQGADYLAESQANMAKIQSKAKEYQMVADIQGNKFSPVFGQLKIKDVFEAITEATSNEVKSKGIDVALEIDTTVPEQIISDVDKVKQIVHMLLMLSMFGQNSGNVKVHIGHKTEGASFPGPFIIVTLDNPNYKPEAALADKLSALSRETYVPKILEFDVDINMKIAKLIANALNWDTDFSDIKNGKQKLLIPINNDREALLKEGNQG